MSSTTNEPQNTVSISMKNEEKNKYPYQQLPDDFIDWQIEERHTIFNSLIKHSQPDFSLPHLPVLITRDDKNKNFPINAVCKGIGLVPRGPMMDVLTNEIQSILKDIKEKDFQSTLTSRIEAASLLYEHKEKIDTSTLGGLEIFESKSYGNIRKNPHVSLFFVGKSPRYRSYQINCLAEIIQPEDPFYSFIASMRALFEYETFHYQQPSYPYAIKYHVLEVIDKSLRIRD